MPVYNALPYLRDAIASIIAQDEADWELIALDDGSSDGSGEFLARIEHPRIRVFHSPANRGVSAMINRGIDLAAGKYIGRMDADDLSTPSRLRRQLQALEDCPEIDLIGTSSYVVDIGLRLVLVNHQPCDHSSIVRHAAINVPMTFGALLGKADWWSKWRLDERIPLAGHEYDLYFRSHQQSCFANVPDVAYAYRFVGHTRSWRKMSLSVYYKCQSLLRNGFAMGLPLQTTIGLASMLPRPLFYALKLAVGSDTGLIPAKDDAPTREQQSELDSIVRRIRDTEVPLLCS